MSATILDDPQPGPQAEGPNPGAPASAGTPAEPGRRAADDHIAGLRNRIDEIDAELAATESDLEDLLLRIPNLADPEVPVGGEEANVTVRTWGEAATRAAAAGDGTTWERRPHWEIGEALDIIDNVRGAKITGSGFPVYKGAGSRLQRSLISWFLDVHTAEHGFTEVWPPAVVNTASGRYAIAVIATAAGPDDTPDEVIAGLGRDVARALGGAARF